MNLASHPSEYALTALLETVPDESEVGPLREHVAACDQCRRRVDDLRARRSAFLARSPFPAFAAACERRSRPRAPWRWGWGAASAAAAFGLVAVLAGTFIPWERGDDPTGVVRMKGTTVRWVVARGDGQVEAGRGFVFRPGDRLGWEISADGARDAVLLSVAPSGETAVVAAGLAATFPASVELTPPLDALRLVMVVGPTGLDRAALREALRARVAAGGWRVSLDDLWQGAAVDSRIVGAE